MLLKSEAENLPAPDTTPVIIEPSREVIEAMYRARQKAEQPSGATVADDPVGFPETIEKWGREQKVPDSGQRHMLSKAKRFAAWPKQIATRAPWHYMLTICASSPAMSTPVTKSI